MAKTRSLVSLALLAVCSAQQILPLKSQSDGWNSSFIVSPEQLVGANLSDTQVSNLEVTVNFERTNYAGGSVTTESIYSTPYNASSLPPGSIIKIESYTNTTIYTLPPNTALSRILYTSVNLLNETVPASAYILWPYLPLNYPNLTGPDPSTNSSKYPVVAWAHGTSGIFAECAPSHTRNLWNSYSAPFELALSGYVVVAPDYQGTGTNTTFNGSEIANPYLAAPAEANDLFYAVQAAQSAFSDKLSKEFMIMGQSQGGNAAWGSAIRQANTPVNRYLGTIAVSPVTNLTLLMSLLSDSVPPLLGLFLAQSLKAFYPTFNQSTILTPEGQARFNLAHDLSMCNSALGALLADFPASDNGTLLNQGWTALPEVAGYLAAVDIGNQPIGGPMLVIQGTLDPNVPVQFTDASVAATCAANGGMGITYARFEGVTHVPVLYASRRIWLDFLAEKFGAMGDSGLTGIECTTTNYTSGPFPATNYQTELLHFLELATEAYQVA